MRILILEDNKIQRQNFVRIIEKNYTDIKIYEAENIKNAQELIQLKNIDVFFIDINLPDGSGIDIAKNIRKIERYELSGIIFITRELMKIVEAFKAVHCYDFIVKPYNEKDIISIINPFVKKLGISNVPDKKYIVIPIENGVSVRVGVEEIIFVEYMNRKCIINTINQKFECKSLTLNSILKKCDSRDIIQSHKSYLTNVKYINKIEKIYSKLFKIYFYNTDEIALMSNGYKDIVNEKWCI